MPSSLRQRREFPTKVRVAAWDRCGGKCEGCSAKLFPGKFAYDHELPDGLGGEPVLSNCRVLCDACHGAKTAKRDVPSMAKADRSKAKHVGARTRKHQWPKRPMNGYPSNTRYIDQDVSDDVEVER